MVIFEGQLIIGAVLSITVKVTSQVAVLLLASVAVIVIVCEPKPTKVPEAGLCVLVTKPHPPLEVALVA